MQRHRGGQYGQQGNHHYDSGMSYYNHHGTAAAAGAQYQDTDSFHSALETIDDADEYEYPMQDHYEEPSLQSHFDTIANMNGSAGPEYLNQFSHPTHRRPDAFHESEAYSQQFTQPVDHSYSAHLSSQKYADEGPSSLQTRLSSFAAPRRRRVTTPPERENHFTMLEPMQPAVDCTPSSSPTPNHALNAQPSNLAPITLPLHMEFSTPIGYTPMELGRGTNARRGAEDGIQQVPVTYLPAYLQSIFSFKHFNKAQSVCFQDLYHTDRNVVVTAPTGAGKTIMFELAFLHMLNTDPEGKAVYLAPMKALCSERFQDWSKRLESINCKVMLLTSDTKHRLADALATRLVIATPEKWDRMTRHARSSDPFMATLRLFLIDEVHIVREMRRGAVMEVLVSRMKAYSSKIRFVAVSATIPNASDFALWIGKRDNQPPLLTDGGEGQASDAAQLYTFSEAFRPCPLSKYVNGYANPRKDHYAFDRELNSQLPGVIEAHSNGKGAIIFCSTRKSAAASAYYLTKVYSDSQQKGVPSPWNVSRNRPDSIGTEDPQLEELYNYGIGFHHAGLNWEDRRKVERAFLHGHISILCSTSSLAVGVNLPAFLVVIKGTQMYAEGELRDYSDLDLFQMMGRAGRPQFDTQGVCVIMTAREHKKRWDDLIKGETTVESTLHHTLIEHTNAEIVVRGRMSVRDMQDWLRETFFYVRLTQKPEYYKLPGCEEVADADEALYVTSRRIMAELSENDLIEDYNKDNDEQLIISTTFGHIMAEYDLRFETMQELLKVKRNTSVEKLIEVISKAKEFEQILLRSGEKGLYEQIREAQGLRFPPPAINVVSDKISVIFQAQLAGMTLDVKLRTQAQRLSLNIKGDIKAIFEHAPNISRAMLRVAIEKMDGGTARCAFELLRCASGSAWENTPAELRQVLGIGEVFMHTLGEAGITTIEALAKEKVERIQLLIERSQYGPKKIIQDARKYPRFNLQVKESMGSIVEGKGVESHIDVTVDLDHTKADLKKLHLRNANKQPHLVAILITTTRPDSNICRWLRTSLEKMTCGISELPSQKILLQSPDEIIVVTVACDTLSGGVKETRIRSSCPSHLFPTIAIVEDSETEDAASIISELREVEAPLEKEVAAPKKRKVQEETSGSRTTPSRILRELQQVDNSIFTREHDTVKQDSSKPPEKKAGPSVKAKPAKTATKKAPKTAATKKIEDEEHKRDRDAMEAKLARIKQRKDEEKKAAKEERERARQQREAETQRHREPTPVHEYTTAPQSEDSSDDEPPVIKRKKIKPADWNFRIGLSGLEDDDDEDESTGQRSAESAEILDRYSPEMEMYDDGEDLSYWSPHCEMLPRDKESEHESFADTGVSAAGRKKKSKREYVIIDDSSDDEVPALQERDGHERGPAPPIEETTYSHYPDDQYSIVDTYADDCDDMPLDWHPVDDVPQDDQELFEPTNQEVEAIPTLEESSLRDMVQIDGIKSSQQIKTLPKSEDEKPLFPAAPSSPSALPDPPLKRNRLMTMDDGLEEFDPEYLEELLHGYD